MDLDGLLERLARIRVAVIVTLALVWCVFALAHLALELALEQLHIGLWPSLLVEAAVAGTIGALLVGAVLAAIWYRHLILRRRIHEVAELNHEVRNSLEIIASSTSRIAEKQTVVIILDAVMSIDHTLRSLFPSTEALPVRKAERRPD